MSQENVEVLRGVFGLSSPLGRSVEDRRRLLADTLAIVDENVEFYAPEWFPPSGLYRGPDGIVRYFREWIGTWDEYEAEAVEYVDAGDQVVVEHISRGRGKSSGVPSEFRHWSVYTFAGGKVVCWRSYPTREDALEAVGLSE